MVNAKTEYESYVEYELGGAQSLNPWRQARQKQLALANQKVEILTNEVNEARKQHDELYITFVKTYTDQEVANALLTAAKKRIDSLKGPKVVTGVPA